MNTFSGPCIRKIISCALLFFFCCIGNKASATYSWKQKSNFGSTARVAPCSFAINGKGYIGCGYDGTANKKDFWEYDPLTDVWTQKADFGGMGRHGPASFAVDGKGYVGLGTVGYPVYNFASDWWEYDPTLNTWTQKGYFPGSPRYCPVDFTIDSKGYMGTGWDQVTPYYKDFWEYNAALDAWTQKADFGGTARISAIGFAVNGKGYAGTGYDNVLKSDFWEYDPTSNVWVVKASFPVPARYGVTAFVFNDEAYVGSGGNGTVYYNDFYKFDPIGNTWTAIANFPGTGRRHTGAFGIGLIGYMGTGAVNGGYTNTFWEYSPDGPITSFNSAQQNLCPGTCTNFYNLTSNATSYQWYFPGASPDTSTAENPINICYANPGSYDVTLITSNANGTDTLSIPNYITLFPSPPPQSITQIGDTLFAIPGSSSYQWYHNGSIVNGATQYFYVAPSGGYFNVVTTDTNGCEVEAVIYDVLAAVAPIYAGDGLGVSLYPNPFSTTTSFVLTSGSRISKVKIEIFNLSGELVEELFDGQLHPGETKTVVFNADKFLYGVYYYRITSGSEVMNGRMVLIK